MQNVLETHDTDITCPGSGTPVDGSGMNGTGSVIVSLHDEPSHRNSGAKACGGLLSFCGPTAMQKVGLAQETRTRPVCPGYVIGGAIRPQPDGATGAGFGADADAGACACVWVVVAVVGVVVADVVDVGVVVVVVEVAVVGVVFLVVPEPAATEDNPATQSTPPNQAATTPVTKRRMVRTRPGFRSSGTPRQRS